MLSEAMVCFPIVILALLGLTLTSQPTVAVGQTLPTTLLDKFDDASKLASIAYCITGAGIGSKITCDRFCCDFPDMILEEVNSLVLPASWRISHDDSSWTQINYRACRALSRGIITHQIKE